MKKNTTKPFLLSPHLSINLFSCPYDEKSANFERKIINDTKMADKEKGLG